MIVTAEERLMLTLRVVTRIRRSAVWLHQQQTGQIRRVHREKVRLADASLVWDEVNPRPKHRQTTTSRTTDCLHAAGQLDHSITDDYTSRQAFIYPRSAAQPVTRPARSCTRQVPPIRLVRRDKQWHNIPVQDTDRLSPTCLVRLHGQWQCGDRADVASRRARRKRPLTLPTALEQKRT